MRYAVSHCSLTFLLVAFISLPAAGAAFLQSCDPVDSTMVAHFEIEMDGGAREIRGVSITSGRSVLVIVDERGIDVRLEVQPGSGRTSVADNPVRRRGPQRLLLDVTGGARIQLTLVTKEGISGTVQARIYAFDSSDSDRRCVQALSAFSKGDAHYAGAQAIALGIATAQAGSLQREYRAAVDQYASALKILGESNSRLGAQASLSVATTLLLGLQSYNDALVAAKEAEKAFASIGDAYGFDRARYIAAATEIEIALAVPGRRTPQSEARDHAMNLLKEARRKFSDVARSHGLRNEPFEQALALNNIGLAHYYADEFDEAVQSYLPAMRLYERLNERIRQAQVMQNIALCHHEMARFRESRDEYLQALQLFKEKENPKQYADTLNNLALTEYKSGYPDSALKHYTEALAILERVQSPREQARSLHGLGLTYYQIGNKSEALDYFARALELRPEREDPKRNIPADPPGRIASLRAAADGMRDERRWSEAFALRDEALRISQTPVVDARILVELARDSLDAGDYSRARQALASIFANDAGDDPVAYGRALLERSRLRLADHEAVEARRDAEEARSLFRARELTNLVFEAQLQEARISCVLGQRNAAMTSVDDALSVAESLRRISSNPVMRTLLWQPVRPAFDFKLMLLAQPEVCGGRRGNVDAVAALELAETSRNRALEDFRELARARSGAPSAAAELRRRELFEVVASRRVQVESLLERVPDNDPRLAKLRAEISQALREIDILGVEIARPLQARRANKMSVRVSAEMIRRDTAVIEYWLGEPNSYAWLITRGSIHMIELGPTTRIDAAARRLHESMRDLTAIPMQERQTRARELYSLIIGPLPKSLARARTVYFVPDGALHAVPFSALLDGQGAAERYLVDTQDIGVAPTVDSVTGEFETSIDATSAVLIVADPVYSRDDARFHPATVTRSTDENVAAVRLPSLRGRQRAGKDAKPADWMRLTSSGTEAAAIAGLFAPSATETLSGFAANREQLLNRDLSRYRIVHFATHAVADLQAPQLSALILSMIDADGRQLAGEVFAGDLLSRGMDAELVVLSACDTALGRAAAGEGLLGMRYAAHASGARSVVASLWPVVDEVGARLMSGLYTAMVQGKTTPVAALSAAMRETRRRWPDPAMWAVFEVSRVDPARTIH